MCLDNCTTVNKKWKQLTWKNRLLIEHLYNIQKKNYTQIAKEIGVNRTTIGREIRSGLIQLESSYMPVWKYSADIAEQNNQLYETAKGPMLKIGNDIKLAKYKKQGKKLIINKH
ncbi:MAG: helix-turn-helix domain-containing protein [Clostridia bacterium]|nr:helix-turn-helix domain-containing protein [Clostridia bacterium]MDD4375819.1 helix-turn-helix domain-containing protein [Clostridia bacterium]